MRCVERKFWTPRTTSRRLCDSELIGKQFYECENETDGACLSSCHNVLLSTALLYIVILPTCVKEGDLEVALPSYYIISYNAAGTITVAVNREAPLSLNHTTNSQLLDFFFVYFKFNSFDLILCF